MKRVRVKDLAHLERLAKERRAVQQAPSVWDPRPKPMPAAVAINMSGWWLLRVFARGLYVYGVGPPKDPPRARKPPKWMREMFNPSRPQPSAAQRLLTAEPAESGEPWLTPSEDYPDHWDVNLEHRP